MKIIKQIISEFIKIFSNVNVYIILICTICVSTFFYLYENQDNPKGNYEIDDNIDLIKKIKYVREKMVGRKDAKAEIFTLISAHKLEQLSLKNPEEEYLKELIKEKQSIEDTKFFIKLLNLNYRLDEILEVENTYLIANEDLSYIYKYLTKPKETLDILNAKKKQIESIIENKDYLAYLELEIESLESDVKSIDENIKNSFIEVEKLKKEKDVDLEEIKKVKKNIVELQKIKSSKEKIIEIYKIQSFNNIKYDENDVKYQNIRILVDNIKEKDNIKIIDKEKYYEEVPDGDYEYYKKETLEKIKNIDNKIKICEYKLKNNIYNENENGVKSLSRMKKYTFISLAILSIYFFVMIYSKERRNGTDRMLFIRPISRTKIILSKLIIITLIYMLIFTIYIGTGVVYSKATNNQIENVIEFKVENEKVIETNFLENVIKENINIAINTYLFLLIIFSITVIYETELEAIFIAIIIIITTMLINVSLFIEGKLINLKLINVAKVYNKSILPYLQNPNILEFYNKYYNLHYNESYGKMLLFAIAIILIILVIILEKNRDIKNK